MLFENNNNKKKKNNLYYGYIYIGIIKCDRNKNNIFNKKKKKKALLHFSRKNSR